MFKRFVWRWFQTLLPKVLLTAWGRRLAESRWVRLKNALIRLFVEHYGVNLSEAVHERPEDYASFNDFFTRALKPSVRSLDVSEHTVVSPADGAVSEIGAIEDGQLLQAKGYAYSVAELLGEEGDALLPWENGFFATIYLSPRDYHRVHMPYAGRLLSMHYHPGKLFSVNTTSARVIPKLFARNERLVMHFETNIGPMAVVMVGALLVSGIHTVFEGAVTPKHRGQACHWSYAEQSIAFEKGDELGHFQLGSTAIVLLPASQSLWQTSLQAGSPVQMGQALITQ